MNIEAAVTIAPGSGFTKQSLELDEPRPDEVRVALRATGICHTDLSFAEGGRTPTPVVFGHEGAAWSAAGQNVRAVEVGNRVLMSYDSCGECRYCRAGQPFYCGAFDALNFAGRRLEGTTALTGRDGRPVRRRCLRARRPARVRMMTGAGAVLNALRMRPDSMLVVVGFGGVGLGAVMAARLAGAELLVAVDPVPARRALGRLRTWHASHEPGCPVQRRRDET